MLGCSGRTVMTRCSDTTPAWVVPGALPGSGVHVASSSVSQQSRFSGFLGVVIPLGSSLLVALKTRKWSVYPLAWALVSRLVGVRVVLACTSSYRELVRAHLTVSRNFW